MVKNHATRLNLGFVVFMGGLILGADGFAQQDKSAPSEEVISQPQVDSEDDVGLKPGVSSEATRTSVDLEGWSVSEAVVSEDVSESTWVASRGSWKIFADHVRGLSGEAGPLMFAGRVRLVGQGESGRVVVGGAKARVEAGLVVVEGLIDQVRPFMTQPDESWTLQADTITVEVDEDQIRLEGVSGAQLQSRDSKPHQATSNL